MVVRLSASHTPEIWLAGAARLAVWLPAAGGAFTGGAGCVAQPPVATANTQTTKPTNRIRIPPGENPPSLHDQSRTQGERCNAAVVKPASDYSVRPACRSSVGFQMVNRKNSDPG